MYTVTLEHKTQEWIPILKSTHEARYRRRNRSETIVNVNFTRQDSPELSGVLLSRDTFHERLRNEGELPEKDMYPR